MFKDLFGRRFVPPAIIAFCFFLIFLLDSCVRHNSREIAEQAADSLISAGEIYSSSGGAPEEPFLNAIGEDPEQAASEEEEEIRIPLIEPKKMPPRPAYLEPLIRVSILKEASSITLMSEGEMILTFGSNFLRVDPNSKMQFKPRSARISVRNYPVGIGTFKADEYAEAVKLAEKWKRDGYTVRIIKAGGPIVQADGTVSDTTVYWVALGRFKDLKSAEKFRDKMFSWGISCWVIDANVLGPRGNIEMVDASEGPRAYADSRVFVSSPKPIRIFDVPYGRGFWVSGNNEDRSYPSPIEIVVDINGKLAAINEVKLEEYVKGVVPVEIRLHAHDEALKTQAVAARTEAMAKLGIKHAFDPYDYCASQHCQEYGGLARRTARTDAAVEATRGEVLMNDGTLVDAVYCATCGGHTESNENVWSSRPNPSLRGVSDLYSNPEGFVFPISESQLRKWLKHAPKAYCADPHAGNQKNFRWRVRFSPKEMTSIVNKYSRLGRVRDIRVLRRGVSGRAYKVKIVGTRDVVIVNKELQIRRMLGGLKSSMFVVDIKRDSSGNPTSFTFYGGGWGHGVGMCQAGAEGMALKGFKYTEILKHYFYGSDIKKLYE